MLNPRELTVESKEDSKGREANPFKVTMHTDDVHLPMVDRHSFPPEAASTKPLGSTVLQFSTS